MADTSLTHVNYGHPGTASYHLENRNWAFARQYTTLQLKRIRTTTSIQSATTLATAPARFPLPRTSATRTVLRTHAKALVKSNPHLSPALGLLPSLALLSAAVSSTAAAYDPLVGTLLSFGSITLANRYETPRRVAALATGEAGNILQLAILNTEVYDWGQGEKTWVEGPTLKDAQNGYWNEEAAPIQQICFAQSGDKSCLLAVRLPTRTVLLRPIYHRQARLVPSSPFYHLPTSVVEPHPVITVQQKDTGGSPHVDFAFNPDHQLQFAIVDQNRTWSVWDIHHRRKGDRYTSSLLARGRINEPEDNDTSSQDGWARILWVADLRTLLVCNRRHLGIVSIQDRSHVYHSCSNIIGQRSTDWILDVKKHPKDRSQFFVLTSSKLALMVVTMSSEAGAGVDKAMVTMLASWKHYRSTEDFTLQMEVQLLSDEGESQRFNEQRSLLTWLIESFVIVYSAVNKLAQVHSFSQSLLSSSTPITCSDPSLVNLGLDQTATISKLHIQPMRGEGMRTDMCFFRLFVTQFNGDLQELVLYSTSVGSTGSDKVVEDFERSTIKLLRAGLSKTALVDEEADFVVANRLAVAGSPSPRIAPQMPRFRPTSEDVPMRYLRDQRLMISSLMWPETASDTSDWADVVQTTNEVEQKLIGGLDYISRPLSTL
ncbi:hypothetical protein GMOD_00007798 [Pyrenophora seminiperda CCB06]|uniref:RRN6 beta-propeller domain-containing protein n=1 Tax=Pyrenophora seminiperda CCB06 TaxID=1302712 RepID=A0A3M7MEA2_9PLEO|nr:hypothetical protein GMOD_00007798 [Pyrenophora seminiperda CCB06]